jgi:tetratricopeptide (TPR) repeat protein
MPKLGPPGPSRVRSTHPSIYMKNLRGRGPELERRMKLGRDPAATRRALAAWHLEIMTIDGDPRHAKTAVNLLSGLLAEAPTDAGLLRARAGALSHVHRFEEARRDLEKALVAAPADRAVRRALASVLRNLGNAKGAETLALPSQPLDFDYYATRAIELFVRGHIEAADEALRRAHGAYADVHPGVLGWIDLQRGLLRLRTGLWPEARAFFRAAYARLPESFLFAEHLAEVEALLGDHARALALYDAVVAGTQLPEFMAARAGVLEGLGRADDAKRALDAADARWRVLLEQHPRALAAHAVSFWLEDRPEPKLARYWADRNLEWRRDPDSVLLAARARAAAGDLAAARALLPALESSGRNVDEFHEGMAELRRALGDVAGAEAATQAARALNPKK